MKIRTLFKDTDVRIAGSVALQNGWDAAVEFGMLADSYREAAQAVVNTLSADGVFPQSISTGNSFRAYPAFFLYRQALELTLKGIIVAGSELMEYEGRPVDMKALYQSHNFEKMRLDVERVFEATGWGWNFDIIGLRSVEDFRRLLAEFDEFDGSSSACRYPVDSAGKPSFAEQRSVNLYDFAETIDALLEVLGHTPTTIGGLVDEYLSYCAEAGPC